MLPLALALLLAPAQTDAEKKATLDYLAGLQTREGGFRADTKAKKPTLRATSVAVRAIKYFGGKLKDANKVRDFVQSCRDLSGGGYADTPGGKADVILTAVGLMAKVELMDNRYTGVVAIRYMIENAKAFEEVRMAAAGLEAVGPGSRRDEEWIKQLMKEQNADGTFGKGHGLARETGGKVACLLRLGGKVKDADAIVKALDAAQRDDGGFGDEKGKGSDLETSYRVLRTYVMLKKRPAKSDAMKAFIAKCRNDDGGYGIRPGAPSSVGGTYFAGILLHWLASKP